MKCLHRIWSAGGLLVLLLAGSGCVSSRQIRALQQRVATLEKEHKSLSAALETQTLRSDSVAVGLEKMSLRLDQVSPPSAQWMKLEKGATIKWYLDELSQNVYIQYLAPGDLPGSVMVSISVGNRARQHALRPGEAVEHRWTASATPRSFSVTCHRVLFAEDGSVYGMFSIAQAPLPGGGA